MARFVAPTSPIAPYVNMLTAHFYPGIANVPKTTTATFLAENKVWSGLRLGNGHRTQPLLFD